jgi:hypothetical protein
MKTIAPMCVLLLPCAVLAADLQHQACASRAMDKSTWWSYRTVDGKACWYRGKHVLPKQSLYWEPPSSLAKAPDVGQPGDTLRHVVAPRADVDVVSVAEPTFQQRWRSLMDDLNAALWLARTPAKQWNIGERQ